MKKKTFSLFSLLFLIFLAFSILKNPAGACSYAACALRLWFEKMIPSLFPFTILSGMIIRMGYSGKLSCPVYPFLRPLFRINRNMCTSLLLGFLFGFPLGAKTIAEQYRLGQLTKPQAQYLLSFCNNIGPVYMLSFALPLLGFPVGGGEHGNMQPGLFLFLLFLLIPLLYGLVLRHTVYQKYNFSESPAPSANQTSVSFVQALDDSITSACFVIARLGGYMVFFMVCNLLLIWFPSKGDIISSIFAIFLEITSGLSVAAGHLPLALLFTMLIFGGCSCFAQTYTCIRDTDLSFRNYCFHKLLQSLIALFSYAAFFSCFASLPF